MCISDKMSPSRNVSIKSQSSHHESERPSRVRAAIKSQSSSAAPCPEGRVLGCIKEIGRGAVVTNGSSVFRTLSSFKDPWVSRMPRQKLWSQYTTLLSGTNDWRFSSFMMCTWRYRAMIPEHTAGFIAQGCTDPHTGNFGIAALQLDQLDEEAIIDFISNTEITPVVPRDQRFPMHTIPPAGRDRDLGLSRRSPHEQT